MLKSKWLVLLDSFGGSNRWWEDVVAGDSGIGEHCIGKDQILAFQNQE